MSGLSTRSSIDLSPSSIGILEPWVKEHCTSSMSLGTSLLPREWSSEALVKLCLGRYRTGTNCRFCSHFKAQITDFAVTSKYIYSPFIIHSQFIHSSICPFVSATMCLFYESCKFRILGIMWFIFTVTRNPSFI